MATLAVALPLDEVVEGMELDADVMDGIGRVLVRSGVVVTEKHLRIFRMCGIADLRVRREVPDEELQPDPAAILARLEAETHLHPRFRRVDREHPAAIALYEACLDRAVKRAKWSAGEAHA